MFGVYYAYPTDKIYKEEDLHILEMKAWKYTKPMAIALCTITILKYILLGNN